MREKGRVLSDEGRGKRDAGRSGEGRSGEGSINSTEIGEDWQQREEKGQEAIDERQETRGRKQTKVALRRTKREEDNETVRETTRTGKGREETRRVEKRHAYFRKETR